MILFSCLLFAIKFAFHFFSIWGTSKENRAAGRCEGGGGGEAWMNSTQTDVMRVAEALKSLAVSACAFDVLRMLTQCQCVYIWCLAPSVCVCELGNSSRAHLVPVRAHWMSRTKCQCVSHRALHLTRIQCKNMYIWCLAPSVNAYAQESVHVHGNSTRVENGKARERASKNHKPRRLLKPRRRRRQWGCGGGGVGGGDDELSSGTHENLFRKENW